LNFEPHTEKQQGVLLSDKRISIAATGIQWGKAISEETHILTPNGYVKAKNIKYGDTLIDRNGCPTMVLGVFPQGLRRCFKIELTDRKSFIVDEEHLHIIKRRGYTKEEIITTSDLYKRKSIWEGISKAQIPSPKPFKLEEKKHFISPYIMGVLLGDGGITYSIIVSSVDDEIIGRVKSELPEGFKIHKKKGTDCDWSIINTKMQHNSKGHMVNKITDELRKLNIKDCKSDTKFIPEVYKYSSIEQRLDLLRGLMDTDGTVEKNKKMEFYSVSDRLSDDVIYLVESLGGKAWKSTKKTSYKKNGNRIHCKLCYRVNIISPMYNVFWLKRKADKYFVHENTTNKLIKNIVPVGELKTVCFSVDSPTKTFIIEGQVVTHNTTVGVIRLKVDMHKYFSEDDNFIVTSPTYKVLYQSTLPPFLRYNEGLGKYNKQNECFKINGGGTV